MLWWQESENRERSKKHSWLHLELHSKPFLRFALSVSSTGGILGLLHRHTALAFGLRQGNWYIYMLCYPLINNTSKLPIEVLLKAAGDCCLSPFPHALKQADKTAALWCANTCTQTHLFVFLTAPCLCIPASEAMSFCSITWKTSQLQLLA